MATRREVLAMFASLIATTSFAKGSTDKNRSVSNKAKLPAGVFTAALTPMDSNLNADYKRLVNHIKWLLSRGNDGIGLLGSTGEANSFSVDERMHILEAVIGGGIPADKLVVGTGCCSITDTVTLTRHAHSKGVGGILVLPPFYYKGITDNGLETYFANLLEKVGEDELQIFLYHFPKLTGVPYSVSLCKRLVAKYPHNIIGMKDSEGDWSHMEEILKAIPGFRLYTGDEKFLLSTLKAGGAGCITAGANLISSEAAIVYKAWRQGSGEKEQSRLTVLRETLEAYPFIGSLKYIFAKWSRIDSWLNLRPPNVIISEDEGKMLEQKLKQINFSNPF